MDLWQRLNVRLWTIDNVQKLCIYLLGQGQWKLAGNMVASLYAGEVCCLIGNSSLRKKVN